MNANKLLSEILSFYKYKVDNNLREMEEIESAVKAIEENAELRGEIKDFAKFYNTTEVNVRSVLCRKSFDKPKRGITYRFLPFAKIVPQK